jgi:hypothetical protein
MSKTCGTTRERKQWFDILMKKEKRGRRSMAIPLCVYKGEPRFGI